MKNVRALQWAAALVGAIIVLVTGECLLVLALLVAILSLELVKRSLEK